MSKVLQEYREYKFDDGTTITLDVNYRDNKVSFVERDLSRVNAPYIAKKWLFAERSVDYMNGWHNILSAMQYAITDAKKRIEDYQKAEKTAKQDFIIKLFVELDKDKKKGK